MLAFSKSARPDNFSDLDFNHELTRILRRLISKHNFPHLCIYGPPGSGKKARIRAFLNELYGHAALKLQQRTLEIKIDDSRTVVQTYHASNFHIEINPSEAKHDDRVVAQEIIKEVAAVATNHHQFKLIIIKRADLLTFDAQQALRRTIERYDATCRVVLLCQNVSKIIAAIKSRFFLIRNPAPTNENIEAILRKVIRSNCIPLPASIVLKTIANKSERDLFRAINYLEIYNARAKPSMRVISFQYKWIEMIDNLAKKIAQPQASFTEIQQLLYDIQSHLIPAQDILRALLPRLWSCCHDDAMQHKLFTYASKCDHDLVMTCKPIISFELFLINFIVIFRTAVEEVVDAFEMEDLDL